MHLCDRDFGCLPLLLSTVFFETVSLTERGDHYLGSTCWSSGPQHPPISEACFWELGLQVHIAMTGCLPLENSELRQSYFHSKHISHWAISSAETVLWSTSSFTVVRMFCFTGPALSHVWSVPSIRMWAAIKCCTVFSNMPTCKEAWKLIQPEPFVEKNVITCMQASKQHGKQALHLRLQSRYLQRQMATHNLAHTDQSTSLGAKYQLR